MSAQWFIGDLHFGHEKVASIRGFSTTQGHDAHVLARWGKQVHPEDDVWVLGDVSGGSAAGEAHALDLLSRLAGRKHLVAGNHDSVSSIHRNSHRRMGRWFEVFESVQQFARIRINGRDVLLSHYPYASQGDGPGRGSMRYSQFRLPDEGRPLVHAHTHHTHPTEGSVTGRELCVSWDAWGRLVNYTDVAKWLPTTDETKPAISQADAVLASEWLADRDARMRAEGIRRAREAVQREESKSPTGGLVQYTKVIDAIDALKDEDA